MIRTLRISSEPYVLRGTNGHAYEAWDGASLVCQGWAAGSLRSAHQEATEHAARVLRARAKAAAVAITGERE